MIRVNEITFILYLAFMTLYFSIGDPDNKYWSGLFFCMNYVLMIWLFLSHRNKRIKTVGMSLSIALLIFSVIKFFTDFQIERFCIFVLFAIAVSMNIYLQRIKHK